MDTRHLQPLNTHVLPLLPRLSQVPPICLNPSASPCPGSRTRGSDPKPGPPALATPAPWVLLEPWPPAPQHSVPPTPHLPPEPGVGTRHPTRRWSPDLGLVGRAGRGPSGQAGPHLRSPMHLKPGLTCVLGLVVPTFVVPRGRSICNTGERAMRGAAYGRASPHLPTGAPHPRLYLSRAR